MNTEQSNISKLHELVSKISESDNHPSYHDSVIKKLTNEIVCFAPLNGQTSESEKLFHFELFHKTLVNIVKDLKLDGKS